MGILKTVFEDIQPVNKNYKKLNVHTCMTIARNKQAIAFSIYCIVEGTVILEHE